MAALQKKPGIRSEHGTTGRVNPLKDASAGILPREIKGAQRGGQKERPSPRRGGKRPASPEDQSNLQEEKSLILLLRDNSPLLRRNLPNLSRDANKLQEEGLLLPLGLSKLL